LGKRVVLSVTNDLTIDNRLHKVCTTLHNNGYEVKLVGRNRPSSVSLKPRAYKTHRISMMFDRGKLFYIEYNFKLFWYLLFQKCDILTANDHDVLFPNFLVSKLRFKKLVFDCHEYFTELPELVERPATRAVWVALEKSVFPFLKEFSTVNKTIANIYSKTYKKVVKVIPNVPRRRNDVDRSIPSADRILIYQGNVHPARGVELMVEALQYLDDVKFWIVGGGDIIGDIKDLAQKFKVEDKVVFHGFVPLQDLPNITTKATIGLSLEEAFGLNSTYSLPNKFLDYIQAGLPVVVSDIPELKRITEQHEIGVVLYERTPKKLANVINSILDDPNKYQQYRNNTQHAADDLCWENYEEELLGMYKF